MQNIQMNDWQNLQGEFKRVQKELFTARVERRKWTAILIEKRTELGGLRKKIRKCLRDLKQSFSGNLK